MKRISVEIDEKTLSELNRCHEKSFSVYYYEKVISDRGVTTVESRDSEEGRRSTL